MKILFLDIDGVLNSFDDLYARTALWKMSNENKNRDKFGQLFDERCVRWLQFIVEKTGCKIVISSTWRRGGKQRMIEMWEHRQLSGEIVDITPNAPNEDLINLYAEPKADRGYEIQEWIDNNNPDKYCIVDDESDMLKHQKFVQTDSRIGLNYKTAHEVVRILNA